MQEFASAILRPDCLAGGELRVTASPKGVRRVELFETAPTPPGRPPRRTENSACEILERACAELDRYFSGEKITFRSPRFRWLGYAVSAAGLEGSLRDSPRRVSYLRGACRPGRVAARRPGCGPGRRAESAAGHFSLPPGDLRRWTPGRVLLRRAPEGFPARARGHGRRRQPPASRLQVERSAYELREAAPGGHKWIADRPAGK